MSYKLLTHPSISTYIWTISLVLTGHCGSSATSASLRFTCPLFVAFSLVASEKVENLKS